MLEGDSRTFSTAPPRSLMSGTREENVGASFTVGFIFRKPGRLFVSLFESWFPPAVNRDVLELQIARTLPSDGSVRVHAVIGQTRF